MYSKSLAAGLCLVLIVGCNKRTVKNTAPTHDPAVTVKPQPTPPAPPDRPKKAEEEEPNWLTDSRFKKDQPKFDPNQVPGQPEPANGPNATGKQPWGITPPAGGWPGAGPNPMPGPGAPANPGTPPPLGPGNLPPLGPGPNPPLGPGPNPPLGPGNLPPLGPGPNPPLAPGLPKLPGAGVLQPNPAPGAGTPFGAAKKDVVLADMRDLQTFIHDASLASGKMPTPGEIFVALAKAGSPAAEHLKSGAIILTGATQRDSVWAYEARALTNGGLVVSQNGTETLTAAELKQRLGLGK